MRAVQIQADIQYKHTHNHESHMKAQTSIQQADIHDTRRQHQTHECIGTIQTHKTQYTSTSTIMSHTSKHKQADSKQTYKHMKAHGWCKYKQAYNTSTRKQTANT